MILSLFCQAFDQPSNPNHSPSDSKVGNNNNDEKSASTIRASDSTCDYNPDLDRLHLHVPKCA